MNLKTTKYIFMKCLLMLSCITIIYHHKLCNHKSSLTFLCYLQVLVCICKLHKYMQLCMQKYACVNLQVCECATVQLYKCASVSLYTCTCVPNCKCTGVHLCQCASVHVNVCISYFYIDYTYANVLQYVD